MTITNTADVRQEVIIFSNSWKRLSKSNEKKINYILEKNYAMSAMEQVLVNI